MCSAAVATKGDTFGQKSVYKLIPFQLQLLTGSVCCLIDAGYCKLLSVLRKVNVYASKQKLSRIDCKNMLSFNITEKNVLRRMNFVALTVRFSH